MKSITIVGENLGCGGTEKVIIKLIRYYEKKGYKTNIVLLSKAKVFKRFNIPRKTRITELNRFNSENFISKILNPFWLIIQLRKYIYANKESKYISFLTVPIILTIISSLNLGILHVASERINPEKVNLSIHWRFARFMLYRNLSRLVVQSNEIAKIFQKYVPKNKINIIPNSVDLELINYPLFFNYSKPLKLLFIGRLEYQKGLDILIEVLKIISEEYKNLPFLVEIVGSGNLYDYVKDSINNLSLRNWVSLKKKSSEPIQTILKSDIILHTSRYEGMSNVVLEGMACGKCVVSSYYTSGEIITNNKNGILLTKLDPRQIIDVLINLNKERIILEKVGTEARKTIISNYSDLRVFKLWDNVL
ncbi:glycosyltransferase [Prochlorococcus marinus]|uniref:glycosyltransferase n=1 Tax=Prochlorococcus marinus TaxID=1219 RepID=UPI001ADC336B|nr:glycosyltransferase [Prochlorococcus marinus]MBO8221435.1 glycosyltransferase family 4 protein [Prochlorococcus marinus CUG1417]MBW3074245.1 hypothetical protein [Prochlorococcus marinus str. MU1417]